MNFFEHQALARRNTRVLVLLYTLAVAGIIVAVDLVLAGTYVYTFRDGFYPPRGATPTLVGMFRAVPGKVYFWGALGTLAVVLTVTVVRMIQLAEGGDAIASMVGARLVSRDTHDLLERRLLNVVEEMAIASGVRVPKVYLMDDERGINAFAAGYDVSNAVLTVTRGTLETLNRDELQGVIGHEFSHVLNGDMWLNIKLMGVLAGIVFIGSVGKFVMRNAGESRDSKASSTFSTFALGLALFLIGYIGLFFARLIKAAVSRQREFLADASSVQFTRNPDGIAGALDQMRASTRGTLIANRYAEELSHMFFGRGIAVQAAGLFDTHPPVEERIRRINPRFQPSSYRTRRAAAVAPETPAAAVGLAGGAAPEPALEADGKRAGDTRYAWGRSAGESVALVGTLEGGKMDFAQRLLATLPPELREQLTSPDGARAAIVALLLAGTDSVMEEQLAAAKSAGAARLADLARNLAPTVRGLGLAFHIPVIDLALATAKSAPAEEKRELIAALETVIHADRRVSLHEFVVATLVRAQLAPPAKPGAVKRGTIAALRTPALALLSLVAHAGRSDGPESERAFEAAFRAGAAEMGLGGAAPLGREALTLATATGALEALKALAPMQTAVLIKGLFAAVSADGTIRVMEAELMRLVGAVLDCPLPPLLENLDPATVG
jgi:Zn-dependent protease with chaperone function